MEMSDMGMTAPETSTREAAGAQAAVEPTATDEPTLRPISRLTMRWMREVVEPTAAIARESAKRPTTMISAELYRS